MVDERIDELVAAVRASAKYGAISPDLIRRVGLRELATRRGQKDAIKATKNKLHQVAGAFLDARPPYVAWLELLRNSVAPEPDATHSTRSSTLQAACLAIMRHHASTRERLPILAPLYRAVFERLPPVTSVLDLACGLNPLAAPWMPLAPGARYYACDLYADLAEFLNGFFALAAIDGRAWACELLSAPPEQPADLALVLKALPTLDQLAKDAGRALLRQINARHLLVSFPARSLGGRDKQMAEHYEARFTAMASEEGWQVERFAYPSELAFLVTK